MKKPKKENSENYKSSSSKFSGRLVDVKSFAKQLYRLELQGLGDYEEQLIADFREGQFDDQFFATARKMRDAMKAAAEKRLAKKSGEPRSRIKAHQSSNTASS